MPRLAGRLWWSFYESDAAFEAFVTRALAYVGGMTLDAVRKIDFDERQQLLFRHLDEAPYLVVLDGLERILMAYARQDAAYLLDDDAIDKETANRVAGAIGLPESAGASFVGRNRLRKAADPRAGRFLQRLSQVKVSRILVSTRLYPAELQAISGKPIQGCSALFLAGLSDQNALDLWRAFDARGSRETMLPVFRSFDSHPLLLQMLGYKVATHREAPGDFDAWQAANPDFDPFGLPLAQRQSHVLAQALKGLTEGERRALHMLAGFRMPVGYEAVKALLLGEEKAFAALAELDGALTDLEDRGLLGWDRTSNRYDLHPIVRGVVWNGLDDEAQQGIYEAMEGHFSVMPMIEDYLKVESLSDLTLAIELYGTLIGMGRYEEAFVIFRYRLNLATLYRLSAGRLRAELLERLFPDGVEEPPRLSDASDRAFTLNALALAYHASGRPSAAVPLFRRSTEIDEKGNQQDISVGLANLSDALHVSGRLWEAEKSAKRSFVITRELEDRFREGVSLQIMGQSQSARGDWEAGEATLHRSLRLARAQSDQQGECVLNADLSKSLLWRGEAEEAKAHADRAWELAGVDRLEADYIRASRLQGTAALELGDLKEAGALLTHALERARKVQRVDEELPALVALARLRRREGNPEAARERLDELWELAEEGPYPLVHADALLKLARLEQGAGKQEEAIEAATEAYRKAWCDGPPFAYHWGLSQAEALLEELGAAVPEMPAVQHEPMPEVEINPEGDEFSV